MTGPGARTDEREDLVLDRIEAARSRPARFTDSRITMAHGAGGRASQTLIEGLFLPAFASPALDALGDAGLLTLPAADGAPPTQLAITTDSFVVKPIRFPGGSIGELAVNGTVNDLAVSGARPLALTLSFVLEEGLPAGDLRAEVAAIARAARRAGVEIVAGDTKVVERGHADSMYVCTTGVGRLDPRARLSPSSLQPGDKILLSGPIGEHGVAIMLARGEFELDAAVASDTRSLWPAVDALLESAGPALRCLRDATRGGVASVLNELARASKVAMLVREGAVPIPPAVAGACEILGIDPMYVANEGKLVAFVAPEAAEAALAALRRVAGCEA
ncbi:MAG TPA: hydrogenase expression/formation protein HypE, partial [Thermoanaerobaculia bacterium]|nr:hydrogenase expression/formation protein HypE [Thermoanaerobaculia bacterium]